MNSRESMGIWKNKNPELKKNLHLYIRKKEPYFWRESGRNNWDVHQSNQVQHSHPFQALYLLPMPAHRIFLPQIGVVQSQNAFGNRFPMAHCTRFAIPLLLLLPRRVAATILNQPHLLLPQNVMNLPNLVPSGMQLMGMKSWDGAAQMVHGKKIVYFHICRLHCNILDNI